MELVGQLAADLSGFGHGVRSFEQRRIDEVDSLRSSDVCTCESGVLRRRH